MAQKRQEKKELKDREDGKGKDSFGLELAAMGYALLFNTPEDKLLELSDLPYNQVTPMAAVATKEDAIKMLMAKMRGEEGEIILLSERFRHYYLQGRRSTGKLNHKQSLATLTQTEMETKAEEADLGEADEL